jgi:hypothetical protein
MQQRKTEYTNTLVKSDIQITFVGNFSLIQYYVHLFISPVLPVPPNMLRILQALVKQKIRASWCHGWPHPTLRDSIESTAYFG